MMVVRQSLSKRDTFTMSVTLFCIGQPNLFDENKRRNFNPVACNLPTNQHA